MSKTKLFLLFTGLSICLTWYGINAKEAQIKQEEGSFISEEEAQSFYTTPDEAWSEEETSDKSHFTSSPSLEAVLQELSSSEDNTAYAEDLNKEKAAPENLDEEASYSEDLNKEETKEVTDPENVDNEEAPAPKDAEKKKTEEVKDSTSSEDSMDTTTASINSALDLPDTFSMDSINVKELSEAFGHFIGKNLESPGFDFKLFS